MGRPLSNDSLIAFSFMDAIIEDDGLKSAIEDAVAKKRASIQADIAVHNALVGHMKRLRSINAAHSAAA